MADITSFAVLPGTASPKSFTSFIPYPPVTHCVDKSTFSPPEPTSHSIASPHLQQTNFIWQLWTSARPATLPAVMAAASDKSSSRSPSRHFHTVSFSQYPRRTLWTAPDVSHRVPFHVVFNAAYGNFSPPTSQPERRAVSLRHKAGNVPLPCDCRSPGGRLSGNTAVYFSHNPSSAKSIAQ